MPGGDAQLAVGGELIDYRLDQDITRPNNTGPASTGSAQLYIPYDRDVKSAYAELYLPFIGPDQDIPGMRSFEVNLSARYDDYSDFGSTTNPKIAFNWGIVDAVMLRANYAEAFVAPALTSRGSNAVGLDGRVGIQRCFRAGAAGRRADGLDRELPERDRHPGLPAGLGDLLAEQRHGSAPHGRQRHAAAADRQDLERRPRHRRRPASRGCA